MALDLTQLEAVLARAAELDAAPQSQEVFEEGDLMRVGAELGISARSVRRAMTEASSGQSLTVSASAIIPGTPTQVRGDLATYLGMRGLAATDAGVWEQRTGWWPDLYRYRVQIPVLVSSAQSERATHVGLTAGLDRIWRVHLLAGVLGLVAAVVLMPVLATGLVGAAVQAGILIGVSWWSYIIRRQAVALRLRTALEEIALPQYRAQPW